MISVGAEQLSRDFGHSIRSGSHQITALGGGRDRTVLEEKVRDGGVIVRDVAVGAVAPAELGKDACLLVESGIDGLVGGVGNVGGHVAQG